MKFLKWILGLVGILGAIAGVGNMLRDRQRIKKIREEVRRKKQGIEEEKEVELARAESVDTVSDARSSIQRMRKKTKRKRKSRN